VPKFSYVVIDLGGVLLELNNTRSTFAYAASDEAFKEVWLTSPSVRRFERGDVGAPQFAEQVVRELGLPYGPREFLRRFAAWPGTLFPGTLELLEQLKGYAATALLSNTNPVHWNRQDIGATLLPLFDQVLLSFQTGLLKPDADVFADLIERCDCAPGTILFLDDNSLNVDAAIQLGIAARHVRGVNELKSVLQSEHIVAARG
jgi:putative hydrolase of the HAD superfamily